MVKDARPDLGPTKDWKQGDQVKGNIPLKPGDAIGYGFDKDGNYPSHSSGNHAAYVTDVQRNSETGEITSVEIAHQWAPRSSINRTGQPVKLETLSPADFEKYSVINHK